MSIQNMGNMGKNEAVGERAKLEGVKVVEMSEVDLTKEIGSLIKNIKELDASINYDDPSFLEKTAQKIEMQRRLREFVELRIEMLKDQIKKEEINNIDENNRNSAISGINVKINYWQNELKSLPGEPQAKTEVADMTNLITAREDYIPADLNVGKASRQGAGQIPGVMEK